MHMHNYGELRLKCQNFWVESFCVCTMILKHSSTYHRVYITLQYCRSLLPAYCFDKRIQNKLLEINEFLVTSVRFGPSWSLLFIKNLDLNRLPLDLKISVPEWKFVLKNPELSYDFMSKQNWNFLIMMILFPIQF